MANTADVCIADAAGQVFLLSVQADNLLKVKRQWDLHGKKITAGPFVRMVGDKLRLACVVDQHRLIWLDPDAAEPLWTYTTADKAILGEPRLTAGLLIVADEAGKFVGLDPTTGQTGGKGYALHGSIAPAAHRWALTPTACLCR